MSSLALPDSPALSASVSARLAEDFDRYAAEPLGEAVAEWARDRWKLALEGRYAGRPTRTPIGKASGQLSMTPGQVEADARAGLGFVVLKTVIAEDSAGARAMEAWAVHESHMRVEPVADDSGASGWTVTWRGRGWDKSFEEYRQLLAAALDIAKRHGMEVVPSVKYHLPSADGEAFRADEYLYTTRALLDTWRQAGRDDRMPLEKDFSPTLAGDARADRRETILRWLRGVPTLVHAAAPNAVALGIKLMNARFDDAFQSSMLDAVSGPDTGVDFVVAFNRLFDLERGVAFGGPALSRRNLRVLDAYRASPSAAPRELSATGDVSSGRRAIEYALRGATSVQLHTFFQLPRSEYRSTAASRSAAAMHELVLHPERGLMAWMLHLAECGTLAPRDGLLQWVDIADVTRRAPVREAP